MRPDDEVVVVNEICGGRLAHELPNRRHRLATDQLAATGDSERGPNPYALLLMSLGACTAMTVRLHAEREGWPLGCVSVRLRRLRVHPEHCASCKRPSTMLNQIECLVDLPGPLADAQRNRLMRVADTSLIHRTLAWNTEIRTLLARSG